MFMLTFKFSRKTAVFIVIMLALVLIGIILLASAYQRSAGGQPQPVYTVKNEKSRVAYLLQYGWEVDSPAVSESRVLIPRVFSDVFENYNRLQKQQGFDLSGYCGLEVELYTYTVLNYGENVVAQLYVLGGSVIGADVHSTQLDGFMMGVRTSDGKGCGPLSQPAPQTSALLSHSPNPAPYGTGFSLQTNYP